MPEIFEIRAAKSQVSDEKNKISAEKIWNSTEKIQKLTDQVNWICRKRVMFVMCAAIATEGMQSYEELTFSRRCVLYSQSGLFETA